MKKIENWDNVVFINETWLNANAQPSTSKVRYEINELALENGHRVLRIPLYHC